MITNELYKKKKPQPDCYLAVLSYFGVKSEECVAIEDSEYGLLSAKAAGCKCICIPNSYTEDHDFSKADLVVDDADEITKELINNL